MTTTFRAFRTLPAFAARTRAFLGAQEVQDDEGREVAAGNCRHCVRRRERCHQDTGCRGARRLLQDRPHGPLHAVGRQEVLRRKDARQDGRVRGEEEGGADPQHERAHRQVPQFQPAGHRQPADGGDYGEVGALHGDDEAPLGNTVGRDPAGQDEGHQANAAGGRHQGEVQRAAAQVDHLVDRGHGPHARPENRDGQGRDQHAVFAMGKRPQGFGRGHRPSLGASPAATTTAVEPAQTP
ncbi:hypothetical protein QF050_000303 [Arthrobacter sp. SLBN-112]|nr:hypothetical protein [Arthrobacter sp. SLBN-112]